METRFCAHSTADKALSTAMSDRPVSPPVLCESRKMHCDVIESMKMHCDVIESMKMHCAVIESAIVLLPSRFNSGSPTI